MYTRYNFLSGFHILYRSHCALEKHKNSGDWNIKNKIVLSWIEVDHLHQLTNLYLSFTQGIDDLSLTNLRKFASKKSNNKVRDVMLQSRLELGFDGD